MSVFSDLCKPAIRGALPFMKMYMNDAIRNAVLEKQNAERVRRIAAENGMVSLFSACCEYVLKGITSLQELMSLYMG